MNIKNFVALYNRKKTPEEKAALISEHITVSHVNYVDKVNRAELIVRTTYHEKHVDENGNETTVFYQNSAAKYMFYSLSLVDLYTDIDVDFTDATESFEAINGEILDMILQGIDERELQEFRMLLEFACDDVMVNEYNIHSFIEKQIERLGVLTETILKPIVEQINEGKLTEILDKIKQ